MDWTRFYELKRLSDAGNDEQALTGLQKMLTEAEGREDRAAISLMIATCLRGLGRLSEARERVQGVLGTIDKESEISAWAIFSDAYLDMDEGKWSAALKKLDRLQTHFSVLLQRPENRERYEDIERKRGIALLGLDRAKEALPLLKRASVRREEQAVVFYCLGKCYYKLDEYEDAQKCLEQAFNSDLDRDYELDARYHLGLADYRLHRYAQAVQQFEWCLAHDSNPMVPREFVLKGLIYALRDSGMDREAERYSRMLHT
ncbi:MAG: tetratricopeptide repeat protein [Candidatus Acidiferrales bacterium]